MQELELIIEVLPDYFYTCRVCEKVATDNENKLCSRCNESVLVQLTDLHVQKPEFGKDGE